MMSTVPLAPDPANGFETSPDYWIAAAAQACGLEPRGTDTLRSGLAVFLADYARSRTTTAQGRQGTAGAIVATLSARFRMEDWIVRHPEVLDRPVERPVIILGMPRAGSTTMVNLLAHDPQRRFYWSWENNREIPPARAEDLKTDPRIARKRAEVEEALAQGWLDHRGHVEMGDEPSECIALMAQDFKSYMWFASTEVPAYVEWLLHEADMAEAYRYHRRALQVMQSRAPGKWTLKMPNHAQSVEEILRVYPDARIVVTHRDPVKAVPSSCGAESFYLALGNEGIDPAVLGARTQRYLATEMERIMALRERAPAEQFHDVHFRRYAADPIGEVRRLYAFLGDELDESVVQSMRTELAKTAALRQSVGAHDYAPEKYGLTREGIEAAFADYIRHYGIERERG